MVEPEHVEGSTERIAGIKGNLGVPGCSEQFFAIGWAYPSWFLLCLVCFAQSWIPCRDCL